MEVGGGAWRSPRRKDVLFSAVSARRGDVLFSFSAASALSRAEKEPLHIVVLTLNTMSLSGRT